MDSFKAYLTEELRGQKDLSMFDKVMKAPDLEIKFVPKYGTDSYVKIRSKSIDPNTVFTMYIKDIVRTDIGGSINIDF